VHMQALLRAVDGVRLAARVRGASLGVIPTRKRPIRGVVDKFIFFVYSIWTDLLINLRDKRGEDVVKLARVKRVERIRQTEIRI